MEFERKPVTPPPFIVIYHIYILIKFCQRKINHQNLIMDTSLKLFLDPDAVEKLHDFEEDCMEDYFKEKEMMSNASADEKLKVRISFQSVYLFTTTLSYCAQILVNDSYFVLFPSE